MKAATMRCAIFCTALISTMSIGPSASANIIINFDDASNPFSAGTISSAQSVSGSSSLFVAQGQTPTFTLPVEYQNKDITISMKVFDQGQWATSGNQYGPRWGVGNGTGGSSYVAASILHKSFLNSTAGYGMHATTSGDSFTGSWFGPGFVSGSTRSGLSATSDNGSVGTGAWTEWSFDVTSTGTIDWGKVGLTSTSDDIGSTVTSILLFGGSSSIINGMYVDDISISFAAVPEPSSAVLLLGVAGFALMTARRNVSSLPKR